jgi:signal transduction histidine kinase
VQHETGVRRIRLNWHNEVAEPLTIDGPTVRQITLNLLLNACSASPFGGEVTVEAACSGGVLQIAVTDEGPGLPPDMALFLNCSAQLTAPARSSSKGLGLWTTGTLIQRLRGTSVIERPAVGTRILVTFPVGSDGARHAA